MKKKFLLLSLVSLFSLIGCTAEKGNKEIQLSYGSLADEVATFLSYSDLSKRIANEESFILALAPGVEDKITCSCWRTFSYLIDRYVSENVEIIYKCNVYDVADHKESFGLVAPTSSDPGIAIFKNGKLDKQYFYSTKNTPIYFENIDGLKTFIKDKTEEPKLIYVNENQLDNKINSNENFAVTYVWKSCSDCGYVLPNVLDPYMKENKDAKNMYLMELEVEGLLLVNGEKDKANSNYQAFLTSHSLNEASTSPFGYDRGFVPTTQYYENGTLKDASVFFNDEISKNEDNKYYVSRSFYSSERSNLLSYLDNVETKVLEGLILQDEEVGTDGSSYWWISSYASRYHTPLLKAFLDLYVK